MPRDTERGREGEREREGERIDMKKAPLLRRSALKITPLRLEVLKDSLTKFCLTVSDGTVMFVLL